MLRIVVGGQMDKERIAEKIEKERLKNTKQSGHP